MVGLNHLEAVELGYNAFVWTSKICLEVDLPNLERIEMNEWALQGDTRAEQECSLVMRG